MTSSAHDAIERSRAARARAAQTVEVARSVLVTPFLSLQDRDGSISMVVDDLVVSTDSDGDCEWHYTVQSFDRTGGVVSEWGTPKRWPTAIEALVAGCIHANAILTSAADAEERALADTCRNCDKPTSGSAYCSDLCEDMDRLPAPRDDMETLTGDDRWYALHDGWVGEH